MSANDSYFFTTMLAVIEVYNQVRFTPIFSASYSESIDLFCCTLLYVHSNIAIILMGKRELVALLNLSSWCLVMVVWLFLAVPWGCLRFVIVWYFLIILTYYFLAVCTLNVRSAI